MDVSFVRVRGERDRFYVHRGDGSEVSWVFPTYGDGLPHDLVHLVVESAFGLRKGFWGRVDAGADPARINDEANRMGGADKYRGFGDDRREILLAEALAAGPWFDAEIADEGVGAEIAEGAKRFGVEVDRPIGAARVGEVRALLGRLREAWRAIEGKGTIELRFDAEDPERGFAAMYSANSGLWDGPVERSSADHDTIYDDP
jgi:hypothetical protein